MDPQLPIQAQAQNGPTEAGTAEAARARVALQAFALLALAVSLGFGKPLWDLARYAFKTELYSHIPLIPAISLYLIWHRREGLPAARCDWLAALVPALLGGLALAGYWAGMARGAQWGRDDRLALTIFAWLCLVLSAGVVTLGIRGVRHLAFPLAFLVFMVPFPSAVTHGIEVFFQHASALASHALFQLCGTPFLRVGTAFQLPGLQLQVAEECSGIRSSLVLFITSLVAGHWFLRTGWRRAVLTLAVIPLGIVRNGIRVVTIALLSIHVDPAVMKSPLHTHGGPLFFLMSLGPFFLMLLLLRWSERRHGARQSD